MFNAYTQARPPAGPSCCGGYLSDDAIDAELVTDETSFVDDGSDGARRKDGTFGPGNKAAKMRLSPGHLAPKKFRKQLGEALAYSVIGEPGKFRRLAQKFLDSEDDRVAFEAFRFLTEQSFGKATIRQEIQTEQRVVAVRFDISSDYRGRSLDGGDGTPRLPGSGGPDADGALPATESESGPGSDAGSPGADPFHRGGNEDGQDGRGSDLDS
jgi:hypothetical protein